MFGQGACHAQCSGFYEQLHHPANVEFRADIQSAYTNCCNQQKATASTTAPAAPASSGVSASDVLTGIGAILAPIAQAGVGIYSAHQQAKLAELQLKQQQRFPVSPPVFIPPPPQQGSSLLPIIIGVVILLMIGGAFFMMQGGATTTPAASGSVQTSNVAVTPGLISGPAASPQRIVKVKRVRKRRRRRPKK